MKLMAFSIMDVKAKAYLRPFFMTNEAQAQRDFGDAVLNPESMLNKHPEDYILYNIGFFDDNAGKFEAFDTPSHVCNAVDFISNKPIEVPNKEVEAIG